jgi:hypothetical protein
LLGSCCLQIRLNGRGQTIPGFHYRIILRQVLRQQKVQTWMLGRDPLRLPLKNDLFQLNLPFFDHFIRKNRYGIYCWRQLLHSGTEKTWDIIEGDIREVRLVP